MNAPRILIADDDQRLTLALSERLKSVGYEVIVANDGYFATASVQGQKPDLLILDIHMPAGDGFSVQERMNNMPASENVPVIYVTGDKSDAALDYARKVGATRVLYKPVQFDALLTAIQNALVPKAA